MSALHRLYYLARADFLERVRRYSFLIVLGFIVFLGYTFVPPDSASYFTIDLEGHRGIYNSAWVGSVVALLSLFFLTIVGFYLVKNTIERDEQTGVGQIIAATPVNKATYLFGKWLSNYLVLLTIVAVVALAALAMQWLRGEERTLDLVALFAPFLILVAPWMAVVAALALLFETVGWLRGGVGNVVYLFLALIGLDALQGVMGISFVLDEMIQAAHRTFADYGGDISIGLTFKAAMEATTGQPYIAADKFVWPGIAWSGALVGSRLLLLGGALVLLGLAIPLFHRFDPARERRWRKRTPTLAPPLEQLQAEVEPVAVAEETVPPPPVQLTPLTARADQFSGLRMVGAELRLMLKGQPWWWWLVLLGVIVAGVALPVEAAHGGVLPIAWLWPLLLWSAMGTRENRYHTSDYIFATPYPLRRQMPATWIAGFLIALLAASGVLGSLLLAGQWLGAIALLVGAAWIPSLALALGVWSGSSKLFEVIYTIIWYMGAVNKFAPVDYTGAATPGGLGMAPVFLLFALALLVMAGLGRQRQLQR